MRSFRIHVGIIPAVAAVLLAACGGTSAPSSAGAPSASSAALIHTASMKVGDKTQTVLKNTKGLTLYYFTPDTASKVACTGGCASNWPPLLASSGAPTLPSPASGGGKCSVSAGRSGSPAPAAAAGRAASVGGRPDCSRFEPRSACAGRSSCRLSRPGRSAGRGGRRPPP